MVRKYIQYYQHAASTVKAHTSAVALAASIIHTVSFSVLFFIQTDTCSFLAVNLDSTMQTVLCTYFGQH